MKNSTAFKTTVTGIWKIKLSSIQKNARIQ